MNAEAKHKIETANSAQKSLLKYYYTRPPDRELILKVPAVWGFWACKGKFKQQMGMKQD